MRRLVDMECQGCGLVWKDRYIVIEDGYKCEECGEKCRRLYSLVEVHSDPFAKGYWIRDLDPNRSYYVTSKKEAKAVCDKYGAVNHVLRHRSSQGSEVYNKV